MFQPRSICFNLGQFFSTQVNLFPPRSICFNLGQFSSDHFLFLFLSLKRKITLNEIIKNSWKNRDWKPLYMSSIYNFRLLQLRKNILTTSQNLPLWMTINTSSPVIRGYSNSSGLKENYLLMKCSLQTRKCFRL